MTTDYSFIATVKCGSFITPPTCLAIGPADKGTDAEFKGRAYFTFDRESIVMDEVSMTGIEIQDEQIIAKRAVMNVDNNMRLAMLTHLFDTLPDYVLKPPETPKGSQPVKQLATKKEIGWFRALKDRVLKELNESGVIDGLDIETHCYLNGTNVPKSDTLKVPIFFGDAGQMTLVSGAEALISLNITAEKMDMTPGDTFSLIMTAPADTFVCGNMSSISLSFTLDDVRAGIASLVTTGDRSGDTWKVISVAYVKVTLANYYWLIKMIMGNRRLNAFHAQVIEQRAELEEVRKRYRQMRIDQDMTIKVTSNNHMYIHINHLLQGSEEAIARQRRAEEDRLSRVAVAVAHIIRTYPDRAATAKKTLEWVHKNSVNNLKMLEDAQGAIFSKMEDILTDTFSTDLIHSALHQEVAPAPQLDYAQAAKKAASKTPDTPLEAAKRRRAKKAGKK